jgi:hypothetical protein
MTVDVHRKLGERLGGMPFPIPRHYFHRPILPDEPEVGMPTDRLRKPVRGETDGYDLRMIEFGTL